MRHRGRTLKYLLPPLLALVVALLLRMSVFTVVHVRSGALEPDIRSGEVAFVLRQGYYEVGDVLMFRPSHPECRVDFALGRVERLEEDSTSSVVRYWVLTSDTLQHPDSRDLGWLEPEYISGRVLLHFGL